MVMEATRLRLLGQRMYRARRVTSTFGRIYLQIKANQFMSRHTDELETRLRWTRFNRRSAESIFEAAVELRGLILKACQFIGSRTDVLPPEYCEVLSQLQDRVPPRPFPEIRAVVERELGMPLDQAFSDFSEKSVASASLAQVHQAHLPDGRRVAVKVQYPEISELVRSDLANLSALFQAVGLVERNFDLVPLVAELTEHLPRELDFCNEAHNSESVAEFFKDRDDLFIPAVHWELTTTRLLVSDFVDGIKINDARGLEAAGINSAAVMQSLVEAYCEQILVHGFFHADPHPGNLMVMPPAAEDEPPIVVFLDFGLAKKLPPAFRKSAVDFAAALVQGNSQAMGNALIDLGFETREDSQEALQLIAEILLGAAKRLRNQAYLDPAVVRATGENLALLIRENPIIRVPSHIVLLGRVFGLLSGLGNTLGVQLDMLQIILPYAAGLTPNSSTRRGGS
jgi:predicted unusual protein kinase regulating ubiquinone biosynthesis (AarF/ABC1/UbiB family)